MSPYRGVNRKLLFWKRKDHRRGAEDAKETQRKKRKGGEPLRGRALRTDLLFSTLGPGVVFLCESSASFAPVR